ncbi:MAG: ComEC/Rec2 family competence protein [Cyclobacteriaceae bacterium]
MSIWSSYPFVRITICFCIGIVFQQYFLLRHSLIILSILLLLFYGLRIVFYKNYPKAISLLCGIVIILTFFFLGVIRTNLQDPKNRTDNLYHVSTGEFASFHMRIDGFPVEKDRHYIYQATLLSGLKKPEPQDSAQAVLAPLTGKLSLYIEKDSTSKALRYGDILVMIKSPFLLSPPKNPHEFDYSKYMGRKGIFHQLFLKNSDFQVIGNEPHSEIVKLSYTARMYFRKVITDNLSSKSSEDIALALILGIKDNLDRELKSAYSSAGAMHVLAVSGLHVGIIHLLLNWIFGFLKRYPSGRFLFMICALFFLWCYAFITGLSPSVLRAVIMFSIVLIGNHAMRFHNIYNSLSVSAFLILLYNPYMLAEVGFQLSYAAVLGIVYLQPRIYQLCTFKNIILDKSWSITCVSIAAQLATFPLGLYYFHQFPTYFLVSNLVVIPASFIILLNGMVLLIIALVSDTLAGLPGYTLNFLIDLLNQSVLWVNWLPYSLIDRVRIDIYQLVIIYLIFAAIILLFKKKSAGYLKLSFTFCLVFIMMAGFRAHAAGKRHEVVFYELRDNLVIDLISDGTVSTYLKNNDDNHELINYQIGPNRLACYLPPYHPDQLIAATPVKSLGKAISWKGIKILLIEESFTRVRFTEKIKTDILVLSGNHFINIDKLRDSFEWQTLIIDSSYKKYRSISLSGILKKENIVHWNINTDGAYIFEVE